MMKKRGYLNTDISHVDNLDELIAIAYQVFDTNKPRPIKGVCTYCCMLEESVSLMYKLPVRELPPEVIYDYLDSAQCDGYALSDEIRYFVPRIFELLYQGGVSSS